MWRLVSATEESTEHPWICVTFSDAKARRQETIYYNRHDEAKTHIGMVPRRMGDPKLNDIVRAADAYRQLTGSVTGFRVRKNLL
jgi:hypothetical protein